uniref:Neutral alpha-glucosidase ab n=1 Tax=Rhizophora mucronata TaxID=61149 RepID=A0A2P2IUT3_RHIMU
MFPQADNGFIAGLTLMDTKSTVVFSTGLQDVMKNTESLSKILIMQMRSGLLN